MVNPTYRLRASVSALVAVGLGGATVLNFFGVEFLPLLVVAATIVAAISLVGLRLVREARVLERQILRKAGEVQRAQDEHLRRLEGLEGRWGDLKDERRAVASKHKELLDGLSRIEKKLDHDIKGSLVSLHARNLGIVEEVHSVANIHSVLRLRQVLAPHGGWAASPSLLEVLLQEVLAANAQPTIVECGSGLSTLVAAYALELRNDSGHLYALEHDSDHMAITVRQLRRHALVEGVEVRHAPLKSVELGNGQSAVWYEPESWSDIEGVDLLFVDGPPKDTGNMARYPALRCLGHRVAANSIVILDDVQRHEEERTMELWEHELPGHIVERHQTLKPFVVFRPST